MSGFRDKRDAGSELGVQSFKYLSPRDFVTAELLQYFLFSFSVVLHQVVEDGRATDRRHFVRRHISVKGEEKFLQRQAYGFVVRPGLLVEGEAVLAVRVRVRRYSPLKEFTGLERSNACV